MKKLLAAMFVALLMVGCGENTKKPGGDSSQSNQSSSETIDLNNPKTRKKIIANAVKTSQLQRRGKTGEELLYRKNKPKPYTGWTKWMYGNGQIQFLTLRKDGKKDGLQMGWHENGQKKGERTYKDGQKHGLETLWHENGQKRREGTYEEGKLWTVVAWKPNGEKCPVTNVKDGNGVWVYYNEDGTEKERKTYREGKRVSD
jgi:antitoxin component YwqK of YwqJK toxin-antitoxin module